MLENIGQLLRVFIEILLKIAFHFHTCLLAIKNPPKMGRMILWYYKWSLKNKKWCYPNVNNYQTIMYVENIVVGFTIQPLSSHFKVNIPS